jgi:hypothetical protein
MKNILQYLDFINEIKRSDLNYFLDNDLSNKFTCSIEIEIETRDKKGLEQDYTEDYIEKIIFNINNSVLKELKRIEKFELTDEISEFIEILLDEVRNEIDDYEYLIDDILDSEKYTEGSYEELIIELIKQQVLTYFYSDNFEYLEDKFRKKMPNFYKKYKDDIKFELDNTLDRGIEISNITYYENINDLITLINNFYSDFEKQNYWEFNERTGIHINIGLKEKLEYNPIKGLLFLNDTGESPFVFNNMEWRKNSKFCGSLIDKLKEDDKLLDSCKIEIENNNIKYCEENLNKMLFTILNKEGYKNFGVNLVPLKNFNYIEFRYIGGNIDKKVVIDKVLYFTYVVHLMTNKDFKRKDYIKKLYKFLNKKTH